MISPEHYIQNRIELILWIAGKPNPTWTPRDWYNM